MKATYVKEIADGDSIDTYFVAASKGHLRRYKNKPGLWFNMTVSDKTGRMSLMYWGDDDEDTRHTYESFDEGSVVWVRGNASEYNGRLQLSVNPSSGDIRLAHQYSRDDLVPDAGLDIKRLKADLRHYTTSVADPQIRRLLESFFDDESFLEKYATWPAAMSYHHAYVGGLMQHSINMVRLAMTVLENYPGKLNTDMLVAGCLLHDIGKLRQYNMGLSIRYTVDGEFLGHIAIGVMMIQERISRIRDSGSVFDEDTERLLLHIVLSHHGELEYGSPVKPIIGEATVVHQVDACDAQTNHILYAKDSRAPF